MKPTINGFTAVMLLLVCVTAMARGSRQDIHASADLAQPLMAGMKAPDFNVRDVEGNVFGFNGQDLGGGSEYGLLYTCLHGHVAHSAGAAGAEQTKSYDLVFSDLDEFDITSVSLQIGADVLKCLTYSFFNFQGPELSVFLLDAKISSEQLYRQALQI